MAETVPVTQVLNSYVSALSSCLWNLIMEKKNVPKKDTENSGAVEK